MDHDVNHRLAERLKQARSARGWTLEQFAEASGVSRAMISKIERAEVSPTAAVLARLAAGLGTSMASLFPAPRSAPDRLSRWDDQSAWQDPASGYIRRNVSPAGAAAEIVYVTFPAGGRVVFDTYTAPHDIEQQVWVLEGEIEMGIGREPEFSPMLQNSSILVFAWGATVPMIAHAAGIELDEITTTWDKWVTPTDRRTVKGVIPAGNVAAVRFTINGVYRGETRIQLEHVNRIGRDAAPDWPSGDSDDVYRVDIEGTPSIFQETAFRFTDGSGRDAATAGCLATGLRALNAVPAVNDLPPGWVTALDLPLIPGRGTIR